MDEITIEKAFSSAMIFSGKLYGRGFQARVCELTGVDSSNLNSIMKKEKGTREPVRRAIFEAIRNLVPKLSGWGYDNFLNLGFSLANERGVIGNTLSDYSMEVLLERYALLPVAAQGNVTPPTSQIKAQADNHSIAIGQAGDYSPIIKDSTGTILPPFPPPLPEYKEDALTPFEAKFIADMRLYGSVNLWNQFLAALEKTKRANG